jgi:hypothetical protein
MVLLAHIIDLRIVHFLLEIGTRVQLHPVTALIEAVS